MADQQPDVVLDVTDVVVRPISKQEVARFNSELDDHHWLGHRLTGEVMRYVATIGEQWVALVGFGSAALSCAPRDRFIGWSRDQQFSRLRCVVNNQRFCVLPDSKMNNLASAVLSRTLKRISDDYLVAYGHPVLIVETFTDPSKHTGSCYAAANFADVGLTLGYRRSAGTYIHHGNQKLTWVKTLRRDARPILVSTFDHPVLRGAQPPRIDLNTLDIGGRDGLLAYLAAVPDHRHKRGIRHHLCVLLAVAATAAVSGARSFVAMGEYASELPQDGLARLGVKVSPSKGRRIAPSEPTLRRAIRDVDAEALDRAIGAWLTTQVRKGNIDEQKLVIALDGKVVRGAWTDEGLQVMLFSAMIHKEGVVIAQRQIPDKTNEITQFAPMLEDLDLKGVIVTADAMHTQRGHAEFLVSRGADYVFTVKDNQPKLHEAIIRLFDEIPWREDHVTQDRGHGRIETRSVQVINSKDEIARLGFPHAKQVFCVLRDVWNLDGSKRSGEVAYCITSLTPRRARPSRLSDLVRGHWGIENCIHYVRDVTFDEDRSQVRKGSAPRAMASLRNPAIGALRAVAGESNIARGLRSMSRDPFRAIALFGL